MSNNLDNIPEQFKKYTSKSYLHKENKDTKSTKNISHMFDKDILFIILIIILLIDD